VNSRLEAPLMKPDRTGLAVFTAFVVFLVLDRGLGMILLFWAASYCRVAFVLRWRRGRRPRGATAFFVNIRSEESKCKEGYAGSCHFACSQAVRPKDELKVRIRQSNWRTTFSSSSLRSTPPIPLAT